MCHYMISIHIGRFCYMAPFNGQCEIPEEKVGRGVITVSTRRTGYSRADKSPPGYGREVKSPSGHGRAEKLPPGRGRKVKSPPGYGKTAKLPPRHGREVMSPPGHGRAVKSPWCRENATPKLEGTLPGSFKLVNVVCAQPETLQSNPLRLRAVNNHDLCVLLFEVDGEGSLGSDGYQENVSRPSPRPLKRIRKGPPRTFKKGWKNNLV